MLLWTLMMLISLIGMIPTKMSTSSMLGRWGIAFETWIVLWMGQSGMSTEAGREEYLTLIYRCSNAEAWIEFMDCIPEIPSDKNGPLHQWCRDMKAALSQYGYSFDLPHEYEDTLIRKGFHRVKALNHRFPMSLEDSSHTMTSRAIVQSWAGSLAEFSLEPMTAKLGYTAEYVHILCSSVYLSMVNGQADGYLNW
jgi:hypothetical protein